MGRRHLPLVSTLLMVTTAAYAEGPERHVIGPSLHRRLLSSKAPARSASLADNVDIFVRTTDPSALAGAAIVHGSKGLYQLRVPLSTAADLSRSAAISRIELAPRMHPLLDKSTLDVGIVAVRNGDGLSSGKTGKGVLVGVLDTGIDPTHPAFLDRSGHTRIVAIWDQDGPGEGPPGFGYGSVCERDAIDAGKCRIGDSVGHGTHVAGILAGAMEPHVGVAPEAELVVVKSSRFTDVAGAVEWMFRVARDQGKPIVVNLSIGGHLGPHDGQSELEQALDRLQGPGRILVAAAGNDGATPIHLSGRRASSARAEMLLPLPGSPTPTTLEIWEYGVNGLEFTLELRGEDGELLEEKALVQNAEESLRAYNGVQGTASYMVEPGADGQLGRTHHSIIIDRSQMESKTTEARWFLAWRSTNLFDAWLSVDDYSNGGAEFVTKQASSGAVEGFVAGDTVKTLTIPGTARRIVTVGSFVTRNEWESRFGKTFRLSSIPLESLSDFSSQGPTAAPDVTGAKPDLVAPGQLIAGPMASGTDGFANAISLDDHFAVMQGTSMSAPHVAGTIALMLQASATLTPEDVKAVLVETTKTDSKFDGETPNARVGYGRLDALAAVQSVEGSHPSKGCHNLPNTEGFMLVTSVLAAMSYMYFQRRLRLFRWRAINQAQS